MQTLQGKERGGVKTPQEVTANLLAPVWVLEGAGCHSSFLVTDF